MLTKRHKGLHVLQITIVFYAVRSRIAVLLLFPGFSQWRNVRTLVLISFTVRVSDGIGSGNLTLSIGLNTAET